MRTILLMLALASTPALADTFVRGHTRSDGTYVQPHYRSNNDGNFNNNWSTQGNTNPYTGEHGTRTQPNNGYGNQYNSPYN